MSVSKHSASSVLSAVSQLIKAQEGFLNDLKQGLRETSVAASEVKKELMLHVDQWVESVNGDLERAVNRDNMDFSFLVESGLSNAVSARAIAAITKERRALEALGRTLMRRIPTLEFGEEKLKKAEFSLASNTKKLKEVGVENSVDGLKITGFKAVNEWVDGLELLVGKFIKGNMDETRFRKSLTMYAAEAKEKARPPGFMMSLFHPKEAKEQKQFIKLLEMTGDSNRMMSNIYDDALKAKDLTKAIAQQEEVVANVKMDIASFKNYKNSQIVGKTEDSYWVARLSDHIHSSMLNRFEGSGEEDFDEMNRLMKETVLRKAPEKEEEITKTLAKLKVLNYLVENADKKKKKVTKEIASLRSQEANLARASRKGAKVEVDLDMILNASKSIKTAGKGWVSEMGRIRQQLTSSKEIDRRAFDESRQSRTSSSSSDMDMWTNIVLFNLLFDNHAHAETRAVLGQDNLNDEVFNTNIGSGNVYTETPVIDFGQIDSTISNISQTIESNVSSCSTPGPSCSSGSSCSSCGGGGD